MRRPSSVVAKACGFQKKLPILVVASFFLIALDRFKSLRSTISRLCWTSGEIFKGSTESKDDYFQSLHLDWHPKTREDRFPSVQERIVLYSGGEETGWAKKCSCRPILQEGTLQYLEQRFVTEKSTLKRNAIDTVFAFQRETVTEEVPLKGYVPDGKELFKVLDQLENDSDGKRINSDVPILVSLGDHDILFDVDIPYFRKFSSSAAPLDASNEKCENFRVGGSREDGFIQPIVWPFNTARHFQKLSYLPKGDKKWGDKKNKVVWRGAPSGVRESIENDDSCKKYPRCHIVHLYGPNGPKHSDLTDIMFSDESSNISEYGRTRGWRYHRQSMNEMLENKVILIVEGNDVSSGLKWALYSRSVVLMTPPILTSWMMEEQLEPWVHYIPLNQDLSNVDDMMHWVAENDDEAKKISERATLFVHDLFYHQDSVRDNEEVMRGLLQVYLSCFGINATPRSSLVVDKS